MWKMIKMTDGGKKCFIKRKYIFHLYVDLTKKFVDFSFFSFRN